MKQMKQTDILGVKIILTGLVIGILINSIILTYEWITGKPLIDLVVGQDEGIKKGDLLYNDYPRNQVFYNDSIYIINQDSVGERVLKGIYGDLYVSVRTNYSSGESKRFFNGVIAKGDTIINHKFFEMEFLFDPNSPFNCRLSSIKGDN